MSAKHTPGPWEVDDNGNVRQVAPRGPTPLTKFRGYVVARTAGGTAGDRTDGADALLIAGAPDLLEAAWLARTVLAQVMYGTSTKEGLRSALATIGAAIQKTEPVACEGHPAGPSDPMGETVYCDGACRAALAKAGVR